MAKSDIANGTVSAAVAAKILGVTPHRLRQLVREGWIPRIDRGRYPFVATVQGYVRFLQDDARRSARAKPAVDLILARTREIELRNARREAELIDLADVERDVEYIFIVLRTQLQRVPDQATADPDMRETIRAALDATLARYQARWQAALVALRNGRDPLDEPSDA